MAQDIVLIAMSALFCLAHAEAAIGGRFTSIPFAAEQGLLALLFLVRRRSYQTSRRPWDWAIASTAWLPMLARPGGNVPGDLEIAGTVIQSVGLTLTVVAFAYLGRSFGIVAANRGLKSRGPYAVVRHPIYFAHTVTMSGFAIANPTPVNVLLVCTTVVGMLLRIHAEEQLLARSADYDTYRSRVRWRLIPGLY